MDVCVCFLKLKLPKSQSIYMNLFRLNHIFIALVTQKTLKLIIGELINLNTLFSIFYNKLDVNLRNAKSFLIFRNSLLKIGRPMQNSIYNIHDPVGIKYLTRLRLGLSHLNEHKFRHNFQDYLNLLCSCSLEVETTNHCFLYCHYYNDIRKTLLDTVKEITNICLSDFSDESLVNLLLHGNSIYSLEENKEVIKAFINFILSSQSFAGALM